jgi:hypothetical protein
VLEPPAEVEERRHEEGAQHQRLERAHVLLPR